MADQVLVRAGVAGKDDFAGCAFNPVSEGLFDRKMGHVEGCDGETVVFECKALFDFGDVNFRQFGWCRPDLPAVIQVLSVECQEPVDEAAQPRGAMAFG